LGIAFAPRNSLIPGGTGDLGPEWQRPIGSEAARARDAIIWVQAGICLIALGIALWATRNISPLNRDTPSYLYFDPSRTVGYPAFLWLLKLLTGHVTTAIPAQMAVLALSLFALGRSVHRLVGRPRVSLLFQILLVSSPDLWRFSAELMTEALATASVALWCAQLLSLIKRPSLRGHLLLAFISAAGMLVRPSLAVLFAGAALAALLLESPRQRTAAAVLIPIGLGAYLLTPIMLLVVHGSPVTTSPVARGVLQHTLFCDGIAPTGDADADFVDRDSADVRYYVESAPTGVGIALQHLYSAPLRFDSIIPALGRLHNFQAGWQTDPILTRVARERVLANPGCYAESVLRNYWQLATQASLHVGAEGRTVDQFLATHPPVRIASVPLLPSDSQELRRAAEELHVAAPGSRMPGGHFGAKTSPLLLLIGRALYGATALFGFAALTLLALRSGRGRNRVAIAAMGLVFHALFLGTAAVELSLIRYTIPAWPMVCTMLLMAFAGLRLRNQSSATSSIFGTPITHQIAPSAATAAVR
jgi:hypothetical protein